jgi:hypothetical protein
MHHDVLSRFWPLTATHVSDVVPGGSEPAERPVERFSPKGLVWRPAPDVERRSAVDANPRCCSASLSAPTLAEAYLGPGSDTHGPRCLNSIRRARFPTMGKPDYRAVQVAGQTFQVQLYQDAPAVWLAFAFVDGEPVLARGRGQRIVLELWADQAKTIISPVSAALL